MPLVYDWEYENPDRVDPLTPFTVIIVATRKRLARSNGLSPASLLRAVSYSAREYGVNATARHSLVGLFLNCVKRFTISPSASFITSIGTGGLAKVIAADPLPRHGAAARTLQFAVKFLISRRNTQMAP